MPTFAKTLQLAQSGLIHRITECGPPVGSAHGYPLADGLLLCETGVVSTTPETGTLIEERVDTDYRLEEGDHERFSHYAPKDKILTAMVEGTPVRALCGKVWVPTRDPNRFPVCPECKEIYESLE